MSNLAIIPMRKGSKGLPDKNIRDFFGKPIFAYTLEHAKKSGLFDEIIISTDSQEIADLCREYGGNVPFMRPPEYATDTAQLVGVVKHVLETYEGEGRFFDRFCLLWATAPMRTSEDIKQAYAMLDDDTDAVVGVTDYDLPVFCALHADESSRLSPLFPEYQKLTRKQQPKAVVDNGAFCWVKRKAFQEHGTWLPPTLKGYWMPRHFSIDIDNEEDWDLASYYYQKYIISGRAVTA